MTKQKTFKHKVRDRAAKTHESYSAARRQLLARSASAPAAGLPAAVRPYSDGVLRGRTGRDWDEWFAILDRWSATERGHSEIARWLVGEHDVEGWWAQGITVGYEQARGMRAPGQRSNGLFEVTVSKTVDAPVDRLFAAFASEAGRETWLPDAPFRIRSMRAPAVLRADWEDGTSRLEVRFTAKGPAKSVVAVVHHRLADAQALQLAKQMWRDQLTLLKTVLLESEG